ncbi:MAG: hypothetical protein U0795_19560 [Pirellulales bacterium]
MDTQIVELIVKLAREDRSWGTFLKSQWEVLHDHGPGRRVLYIASPRAAG